MAYAVIYSFPDAEGSNAPAGISRSVLLGSIAPAGARYFRQSLTSFPLRDPCKDAFKLRLDGLSLNSTPRPAD
ncbi:MAG TPA: hypothetical protein VLY63_21890 [Anaerolineae bacterium]|nr:hypothetical protein [Anaerolineae bacterium]